jgi:lipoprotein NlpD
LRRLAALVVASLLLGACSSYPPKPVVPRASEPPRAEIPIDGLYRVHRGDTLFGIAFKYGLDYRSLAVWNSISAPYTIYPDQVLRLRAPATTSTAATSGVRQPSSSTRTDSSPPPKPKPVPAPAPVSKPPPAAAAPPAKVVSKPPPQAASSGSSTWAWPVQGRLLRTFKAGDPTRNGIDIVGQEGAPVLAASSGEVVYSGNGLIGYGELVIISHDERMLSAYAHNRRRLVAEGETIRQGQKIAEVGRNDRNETVLHFEIRRDGKPVDPLKYLPQR